MQIKCSFWNSLAICGAIIVAMLLLSGPAQGAGEKVYKAKCASCHGPDGAGATPAGKATKPRDFCSEEVKNETDEQSAALIVKGKNKMLSSAKKITDQE